MLLRRLGLTGRGTWNTGSILDTAVTSGAGEVLGIRTVYWQYPGCFCDLWDRRGTGNTGSMLDTGLTAFLDRKLAPVADRM